MGVIAIISQHTSIEMKQEPVPVVPQIERRSGATFGYVGEWHSHPNGPDDFSTTDFEEFANKAEEMVADGATKPILEVLVSPAGVSCAVLALV